MPNTRYFIDQDMDSNWYLIPEMYRAAWNDWRNAYLGLTDTRPFFAHPIDDPGDVTFTTPLNRKEI